MSNSEDIKDEVLKTEIESILKDADLAKVSLKKVMQKLEEKFGVDLKPRKKAIDQMIMDYVNNQDSASEEEEIDEAEKKEEEETKSRKRKAPKKEEVEEEEEDEEEEEAPKTRTRKAAPKPKKAPAKPKGKGGKKNSGYTRAYKLSPALADLMGKDAMPRHEVVKRVWEIIKEDNLYDPKNKQFAICNDALYKVFGIQRFRTFGMMKYLKNHFLDD